MAKKYKILNGEDYFYKGLNNKKYIINICDTKSKIDNMIKIINFYIKNNDKYRYVGIDFEFNKVNDKREIALCQLNLENSSKEANIFLFYPPDLSKDQKNIFINLLINQNIIKILHGGESLDIPYLFDNILINEKNKSLFCLSFVDSRYLCEFYHLQNKIEDGKCKINYLLVEMNVISKKQFDFLQKEEENMGPIYEIVIDVKKLDNLVILYTLTDVLYLPELIKKFPNNDIYNKLIPQITSFCFTIKRIADYDKLNQVISKYNINYLKIDDEIVQLNFIYNMILYMIEDKLGVFYKIIEINYFKKVFALMIKFYLYNYLIDNFEIWSDNKNMVTENINLNLNSLNYYKYLFNYLNKLKLNIKEILYQ